MGEDKSMIKLRNMAMAFLINNGDFLLIKRSESKKFAPGIWAGVGGHLERDEINDPQKACIREIYEETGICEKDLEDFKLKYIVLRRSKDEIRINYVYTAKTNIRKVINTDEGELFWVSKSDIFNKILSATTRMILNHYLKSGDSIDDILVGTVGAEDGRPYVNWHPVQDWEGFI